MSDILERARAWLRQDFPAAGRLATAVDLIRDLVAEVERLRDSDELLRVERNSLWERLREKLDRPNVIAAGVVEAAQQRGTENAALRAEVERLREVVTNRDDYVEDKCQEVLALRAEVDELKDAYRRNNANRDREQTRLLARVEALRAGLATIRNGKTHEDNESGLREPLMAMAFRFHRIAADLLAADDHAAAPACTCPSPDGLGVLFHRFDCPARKGES